MAADDVADVPVDVTAVLMLLCPLLRGSWLQEGICRLLRCCECTSRPLDPAMVLKCAESDGKCGELVAENDPWKDGDAP
jgi:hypothetical protein